MLDAIQDKIDVIKDTIWDICDVFYFCAEIPLERPMVAGGRQKYAPGDIVRLNCTSSPSKPAASLTWFINGKRVTRDQVRNVIYI